MIAIRDARVEDAEELAGLLNAIIAARLYTAFDTPVTVEAQRAFIRSFPARGVFLVATDPASGGIAGFQDVSPFADYTHAFDHVGVIGTYVALERRRQGIATALFEATFEAAGRKGYEKIFAYVRADNTAALQTYARHGFGVIGTARRHAKIDGRYIDEILMERFLPPDC